MLSTSTSLLTAAGLPVCRSHCLSHVSPCTLTVHLFYLVLSLSCCFCSEGSSSEHHESCQLLHQSNHTLLHWQQLEYPWTLWLITFSISSCSSDILVKLENESCCSSTAPFCCKFGYLEQLEIEVAASHFLSFEYSLRFPVSQALSPVVQQPDRNIFLCTLLALAWREADQKFLQLMRARK